MFIKKFKSISRFSAGILIASLAVQTGLYAGHTNTVLEAELDGKQEVALDKKGKLKNKAGDKNGEGEAYVFGIDGDLFTLCYVLVVEDIQLNPVGPVGQGMAAHIHEAPEGQNGGVVAVLAGPEDGTAADCLTEGEEGKFPTGEPGIVQRILNNPEDFYINVHNVEFPPGAIRGQLEAVEEDDHDDED
ncbi:MAG: CHRD domain-containing protein [Gammaproteobacteria bacterium]|nr:CHRD domain-containing protein [Gammaproteobacteria bacterium]